MSGVDSAVIRNQEWAISYLQNHPCIDCGEDDIIVLDFDHVPNRGKKYRDISSLIGEGYSLEKLLAEVQKCDVVCANCHRRRTSSRRLRHYRVHGPRYPERGTSDLLCVSRTQIQEPFVPRNMEAKREYDRERYAKLRKENPAAVREAEQIRKAAQRKRRRDPYSNFNTTSIDEEGGERKLERDTFRGIAQLV